MSRVFHTIFPKYRWFFDTERYCVHTFLIRTCTKFIFIVCCYMFRPWILDIFRELQASLTHTAYVILLLRVSGRLYASASVSNEITILRRYCQLIIIISNLSDDRSKATTRTTPPLDATEDFLLQMKVSSPVLKVIKYLLMYSSSSSCHFYLPLYLSFRNFFRRQFLRRIWPIQLAFRFLISCRIFLCSLTLKYHFIISHMIVPADLLHPSPTPHFRTFQVFLIYYLTRRSFRTIESHALNVAYHEFLPQI
jgi:hypothetical protein